MAIASMMISCSVFAAVWPRASEPEGDPTIHAAILESESSELPATLKGFECLTKESCPPLYRFNKQGDFEGCSTLGLSCVGDCYTCSGAPGITKVCSSRPLHTCHIGLGPIIPCGNLLRHVGGCTSVKPAGFPITTPNGCYCDTSSVGTMVLSGICSIAECF